MQLSANCCRTLYMEVPIVVFDCQTGQIRVKQVKKSISDSLKCLSIRKNLKSQKEKRNLKRLNLKSQKKKNLEPKENLFRQDACQKI